MKPRVGEMPDKNDPTINIDRPARYIRFLPYRLARNADRGVLIPSEST
jgi:hypothetical protein